MPGRLLSFRASDSIQQKRMVDIILMAALADGALDQDTIDRIARAMQSHSDFTGLSWDWVIERAGELGLDAPMFSDARSELRDQLSEPSRRRLAISLAANIAGAGRPLREEERAILYELGVEFGIVGDELEALLQPADERDTRGFLRSASNTQEPEAPTLFDAIAKARTDPELRMMMYKLCAIRRIVDDILPGSVLVSVGEGLKLGEHFGRVDAVVDLTDAGQCIVRCLAEGEALHATEHEILGKLAGELKELSFLMIAHQGSISLMDQAFLKALDPARLRVEKVDIWEAVT